MPSTDPTLPYISIANKNTATNNSIYAARVVANYGDPGLQEDYFSDILSRYVICVLESANRVLTNDKYKGMLIVVERPQYLWINYSSNIFVNNPNTQLRVDALGNTNTGPAASYTVSTISPITPAYNLGDIIQVKLKNNLETSSVANNSTFFQSACSQSIYDQSSEQNYPQDYYGSWHTQGLNSNPYIQQYGAGALEDITIDPVSEDSPSSNPVANSNPNLYNITLNKPQYEAFILNTYQQGADEMVALFQGQSSYTNYYLINGGYFFYNNYYAYLNVCSYVDLNVVNRARILNTSCLPLIVNTPNSWTVPQVRAPSVIAYSPTYIQSS